MDSGSGNASSSSAESAKTTSSTSGDANTRKGCVCASATNINIRVTPTTGGHFDLSIAKSETIENLKKVISKKLKVPKERICLLHRDRQLRDGTVTENQLMDGSRLTLLPSVETGLLAQRPEQSVMQALESLNDAQVNDFLSGKAPLNLTMRLGDHMMLIQLQLSTVTPSGSRRSATSTTTSSTSSSSTTLLPDATTTSSSLLAQQRSYLASSLSDVISGMAKNLSSSSSSSSKTTLPAAAPAAASSSSLKMSPAKRASPKPVVVASNVKSSPKSTSPSASRLVDPMMEFASSFRLGDSPSAATPVVASPARFGGDPAERPCVVPAAAAAAAMDTTPAASEISKAAPSILKSLELATKRLEDSNMASPSGSVSGSVSGSGAVTDKSAVLPAVASEKVAATTSTSTSSSSTAATTTTTTTTTECKCEPASKPVLDTRALAEASRNLTQTLKQLSSEVLTSRSDPAEDTARARRQGAIIESMHHHGKGVYSGTFSGTLNPALQDRFGRPKRDISTIIHILNDLLCATPQYRRHARQGATITVEAATSGAGTVAAGAAAGSGAGLVGGAQAGKQGKEEAMEFGEDSLLRENQATRGKLEQLRLIMEERRARRRARRSAARSAPYTTQWSAKSETLNAAGAGGEPMETADTDLCEMTAAPAAGSVVA